jgi:hypothetical protein
LSRCKAWFRLTTQYFEELRQRGIDNAVLARNRGNAWLLTDGEVGWVPRGLVLVDKADLRRAARLGFSACSHSPR